MKYVLTAAALALSSLAAAVAPATAQPRPAQDILIRLAGADTIGEKGALELATSWTKQLKFSGFRVDQGTDPFEYDVVAQGAEGTQRLRIQVRMKGGNEAGLEALLRGQADFWMASRPAKEGDLEAMRKKNIPNLPPLAQFQQPGVENVIGLSALAIVISPKNPITGISPSQIKDMYQGRITNWSGITGGTNTPVSLYGLIPAHGESETFCAQIMGNTDTKRCVETFSRLAAPPIQEPEDMADGVSSAAGGIGYVDLNLKRGARAAPVSFNCGQGVEPTLFRIKAEEYPLTQRLILYSMPGRALNPAAKAFLQFTYSPAGQAALAAAELADLSASTSDPDYASLRLDTIRETMDNGRTRVRVGEVKNFEKAIAGADRLTVTFRFQSGTNNLDSRAEADIGRLAALMQQPPFNQSDMVLIGFSSSGGEYTENRILSQERADTVRDRLAAAGVRNVTTLGVGPAGAVACNLDPTAASQNQRVEVWLRKRG